MKGRVEQIASVTGAVLAFASVVPLFSLNLGFNLHWSDVLLFSSPILLSAVAAVASIYMTREMRNRRLARRVFFVYSHVDQEVADKISIIIKEAGFEPWIASEKVLPGQVWKSEINEALNSSGIAVILISKNLGNSSFATMELVSILRRNESGDVRHVSILPIRLDESDMPAPLTGIQYLNIKSVDWRSKLVRGLNHLARGTSSWHRGSEASSQTVEIGEKE